MGSTEPKQRPRLSGKVSDFVTIIVGPDASDPNTDDTQDPNRPTPQRESFLIHTAILTHHSAFFRAAFNSSFSEAQTRTLSLPTESIFVFEIFTHWLYYQRLPSAAHLDTPELVTAWLVATQGSNGRGLLDLYVFADKYQVTELKTHVLEQYFRMVLEKQEHGLAGVDMVTLAFEMLPSGDAFCRLLVDARCFWDCAANYGGGGEEGGGGEHGGGGRGEGTMAAANAKAAAKKDDELAWPVEFLVGVMKKYAASRAVPQQTTPHAPLAAPPPGSDPLMGEREHTSRFVLDICDYHDHAGSEERSACRARQGGKAVVVVDDGKKKQKRKAK